MDIHQKKTLLQATLTKNNVAFSMQEHFDLAEVWEWTYASEQQLGFHAAWLLENYFLLYGLAFQELLPQFIARLALQTNPSCQRSFTKILMAVTGKQKAAFALSEEQEMQIIETSFNWMCDRKCLVALRVNCFDILYNLSSKYDWIVPELAAQITLFMDKNPSPALLGRGRRILRKLPY